MIRELLSSFLPQRDLQLIPVAAQPNAPSSLKLSSLRADSFDGSVPQNPSLLGRTMRWFLGSRESNTGLGAALTWGVGVGTVLSLASASAAVAVPAAALAAAIPYAVGTLTHIASDKGWG